MKGYITVRKVEMLRKRLIEAQAEFPHFTKVVLIYGNGYNYVFDYINEALNSEFIDELVCECSFIQKDLITGRDIIVVFVNVKNVHESS